MKIKRSTANKMMTRAVKALDQCLLGVMDEDESLYFCDNKQDMISLTLSHSNAIWFYNQHPDALEVIEQIDYPEGQGSIEIFQDTEGVFGLRAYQQMGKLQTPVTLELSDINA